MKKYIFILFFITLAFVSITKAQGFLFSNDLRLGSSGFDVVQLQTWLIANGYDILAISSKTATKGYFGPQTRAAVVAYQRTIGLPPYGFFGPLTRARLNGNWHNPIQHSILPTTLSVAIVGQSYNQELTVDGKGADIRLKSGKLPPGLILATAISDCAAPPPGSNSLCGTFVSTSISGTPTTQGIFTFTVMSDPSTERTYTMIVNSLTNRPPVISGIDAPTTLSINQSGTWTIHATDPENGTLNYSVDWGDTYTVERGYNASPNSPQFIQSTGFTHSYSNKGIYTITFTVMDSTGLTAKTTTTINVQ